jgi:hypothetical protein
VKLGDPTLDLLRVESKDGPEPVAGNRAPSSALVDPALGHVEESAQVLDGPQARGMAHANRAYTSAGRGA